MNKFVPIIVVLLLLPATAFSQGTAVSSQDTAVSSQETAARPPGAAVCPRGAVGSGVAGVKEIARDAWNTPVSASRQGRSIWNNSSIWGWWPDADTGYLNLDWGHLPDQGNGLPDEVVDGFTFTYGTNNMDPAGETFSVYFFDSFTGYGGDAVPEAGFTFAGLPNAATFGSLPPGQGWTIAVAVDLQGSGYEFLLGERIGIGYVRETTPAMGATGPCLGSPSGLGGNGYTGTGNRYDTYYPGGGYENTWWGGSNWPAVPWGTFPIELCGDGDPGCRLAYEGIGLKGNDLSLYSIGEWSPGSNVQFLLRKNELLLPGWLFASTGTAPFYIPSLGVTLLTLPPLIGPFPATPDPIGDFDRRHLAVSPALAGLRLYFQGAATALGPIAPIELSNGVRSN